MRLRIETLLWGGDEAMFVLPAWELMSFMPVLAAALEADCWKHAKGYTLSHAVGIAICNYKTPIAVAKRLAEDIANASKPLAGDKDNIKARGNVFSWQIHESVEPPQGSLEAFRQSLYGVSQAAAFTLKGRSEIEGMLTLVRRLQSEGDDYGNEKGLPRSQLYGLIRTARKKELLKEGRGPEAEVFLKKEVAQAFQRCGCAVFDEIASPRLGYTPEQPLLPLLRLAEMWDYVDPIDEVA